MHPLKTIFRIRSVLLSIGLIALWGSAAGQLRPPYNDASDSTAATATAPDQASKPSRQVLTTEDSIDSLRKKAEAGDVESQYLLGNAYRTGAGVEKNLDEAVKWFRKAADQGDAVAQTDLGTCYIKGEGIEKDATEAEKWFSKAAQKGYPMAQCKLGFGYLSGEGGLLKNAIEGIAWLDIASANGDQDAAKAIPPIEIVYSPSILLTARQRATEIQAQISTNKPSVNKGSVANRNTPTASGSGAFISADGFVLTAAHVVQGASRIMVVANAGTFEAKVVKIDATNDIALLKCTGSNFTPLPIAPSKEVRTGKSVFTVGFPNIQIQGFDPKLTKGEISSQAGFQDDPREWQISVPIQPGNSGGPLCDENGNLIGIVEATLNPLTMAKIAGEIPQDVNYAVKSSYILPLLDDVQNLPMPQASSKDAKFEDVVGNVQKSAVLILVY